MLHSCGLPCSAFVWVLQLLLRLRLLGRLPYAASLELLHGPADSILSSLFLQVHELARMPRLLSQLAAVKIVLLALEELQLCPGNNDESAFEALMGSRRDGALYQRGSGGGATARVETEPFDCWYGRVTWTVRAQALPAASSATDGGSQAADGGGQAADGGGGAAEGGSPAVGGGNQATGNGGQATDSSSQAADIGGHAASGCGLLVRSGGRCEACRRVRSHLRMAVSREHASEANPLQAAYGRHLNNLSHDVLMAENSHLTRECEALRKRKVCHSTNSVLSIMRAVMRH